MVWPKTGPAGTAKKSGPAKTEPAGPAPTPMIYPGISVALFTFLLPSLLLLLLLLMEKQGIFIFNILGTHLLTVIFLQRIYLLTNYSLAIL